MTTNTNVSALRARLDGQLTLPGENAWDDARKAWNLTVDQQPAMVIHPRSAGDVQAAVTFARQAGLRIAMQCTGHSARPLGSLDGTLLVKTSEMRTVTIDAQRRIARAEAGALWGDVTEPASRQGLAPLAGSSAGIGVVGYTLAGGMSWLGRQYGLASQHVLAAELVTSDGQLLRADAGNHTELLWALCGGGGSFGAVTAIEFELFPLPRVYAGMMLWPAQRASEILHAWRDWTATAPDTFSTSAGIRQFPALPGLPDVLRGRRLVVIDGACLSEETTARQLLTPLRALEPEMDTFAMVPPAALSHIDMEPEDPIAFLSEHAVLDDLPPNAIEALVELAAQDAGSPLALLALRHLGGAFARPGNGALASLPGAYTLFAVGVPLEPHHSAGIDACLSRLKSTLAPHYASRQSLNLAERQLDPTAFHNGETYARLRRIKAHVDPDDLFRGITRIAPATAPHPAA